VLIRVDQSSSVAIYSQIAAAVRREVASGAAREGDRLPAARDLAEALGINLHTVLRGYQELRDEGLVDLRRGRGAVVAPGAAGRAGPREAVRRFAAEMTRAGLTTDEAVTLLREEMAT